MENNNLTDLEDLILNRAKLVHTYYLYGDKTYLVDLLINENKELDNELEEGTSSSVYYEPNETDHRANVIGLALDYPKGFESILKEYDSKWCALIASLIYAITVDGVKYERGILSHLYETYVIEMAPSGRPDEDLENFANRILELIELIKTDIGLIKDNLEDGQKFTVIDIIYTSEVDVELLYIKWR